MNMKQRIAWKHVVNPKGNLYLMDEAEKTYIVDFSKLNSKASRHLHQMHLFHMIAVYALPISIILLTLPMKPDLATRLILVTVSIGLIYLIDYLFMIFLVIPTNIREILEEKKRK